MRKEEKAIGLLDSGLGGLSVFRELKKQLPLEQVIYFGDTAHAPYGEKTDKEVLSYVTSIIDFLLLQEVKLIIMACNTATAVALEKVKERYSLPIIGVIQPGAMEAARKTRNKRIGIVGTEVTIRNKSYEKMIKEIDQTMIIFSNGCSNQIIREMEEYALKNKSTIKTLLKECIEPLIKNGIDTLVWGCTHYPFLREYIEEEIDTNIVQVDPSEATIREVKDLLHNKHLNNNSATIREDLFFISGNPDLFAGIARKLLGYSAGKFQKVRID
ncbi:MAG: glutamate racemase [Atribacterota bacterium]